MTVNEVSFVEWEAKSDDVRSSRKEKERNLIAWSQINKTQATEQKHLSD